MVENCEIQVSTLETVVQKAARDLHEDYAKVKATYQSWAKDGLQRLSDKGLNLGLNRELLPINWNTRTVNIPIGAKIITYVGIINDCGVKEHLLPKSNIVGKNYEEKQCVEKCSSCNNDVDVCEKLQVVLAERNVNINGTDYKETITQKIIDSTYYVIKKTPYLDTDNIVKYLEQRQFLTEFDLEENCGCVKPTQKNIESIKEHCPSCYYTCFDDCFKYELDRGSYAILPEIGIIQLGDLDTEIEKIYVEYTSLMPKRNGVFIVPELAVLPLVAYVKWKANEHKKSMSLGERQLLKREYQYEVKEMYRIMGKMDLGLILNIVRRTPTLTINYPTYVDSVKKQEAQAEKVKENNIIQPSTIMVENVWEQW